MHEIIYLQAGNFANHVGTHFFNAQELYAADDVSAGVSFHNGDKPTFTPRLLLFDFKPNFGTLSPAPVSEFPPAEDNLIDVYREPIVEKSPYQLALEHENEPTGPDILPPESVRYWSDYTRSYYAPQSLHPIVPPPSYPTSYESWEAGVERFNRLDAEAEIVEGALRHFAEQCDLLQGFQCTIDSSTFGSFGTTALQRLRDDFPKSPILTFVSLSPFSASSTTFAPSKSAKNAILNDIRTLSALASSVQDRLADITVPLLSPITWSASTLQHLDLDIKQAFHTSAVLSAHIESATLPLRLTNLELKTTLYSLCTRLNETNRSPIASLAGLLPFSTPDMDKMDAQTEPMDFTNLNSSPVTSSHAPRRRGPPSSDSDSDSGLEHDVLDGPKSHRIYSRFDIVRGTFSPAQKAHIGTWIESSLAGNAGLGGTSSNGRAVWSNIAYPIPSSYPQFFTIPASSGLAQGFTYHPPKTGGVTPPRVASVRTLSSLFTTSRSAELLGSYVRVLEGRGKRVGGSGGVDSEGEGDVLEEMKVLRNAYEI